MALRLLARRRTGVGARIAADWRSCAANTRDSFLRALLDVIGKRKDSGTVQR